MCKSPLASLLASFSNRFLMKSNWGKKKKQLDQGIFAAVPTYKGS
jgi:hypothetical protein